MYDLLDYAAMIADTRRVEAFTAALRAVIKPGSLVLEIGTGIGVFAIMAKQMGAGRVIAIEPNDAIAVARLIAQDNHSADGIEFIQCCAKDLTLSERADVILADIRGTLPAAGDCLVTMIDARERFLRPGGTLIPAVDTLRAAVVEVPKMYAQHSPTCTALGMSVDLRRVGRLTTNSCSRIRFSPDRLLTSAETWAQVDYRTLKTANIEGIAKWTASRNGTGYGFAAWFDATLAEDVVLSNGPDQPEGIYRMLFFPWSSPVELRAGDEIQVHIRADLIGDNYVWRWDTEVRSREPRGMLKAEFRQSTFHSRPFSGDDLRRRAGAGVLALNEEGQVESFILQSINGETSNREIAQQLMSRFPLRFRRFDDALGRVGDVAQRLSISSPTSNDQRSRR